MSHGNSPLTPKGCAYQNRFGRKTHQRREVAGTPVRAKPPALKLDDQQSIPTRAGRAWLKTTLTDQRNGGFSAVYKHSRDAPLPQPAAIISIAAQRTESHFSRNVKSQMQQSSVTERRTVAFSAVPRGTCGVLASLPGSLDNRG